MQPEIKKVTLDDYLNLSQVCALYKMSQETVMDYALVGKIPPPWFLRAEIDYDLERRGIISKTKNDFEEET
jgi:hypothetical protein